MFEDHTSEKYTTKNFKKLYGPFLWMGFNCLKARATSRRQFTFYHSVPRNFWYSLYRLRKDERLSRPWSHPVVLNTGPLDWESSALTTRFPMHWNDTWKLMSVFVLSLNKTYVLCLIYHDKRNPQHQIILHLIASQIIKSDTLNFFYWYYSL